MKGLLCIGFLGIHLVKLVTKVLKIELTNTSAVSTVLVRSGSGSAYAGQVVVVTPALTEMLVVTANRWLAR